MKKFIAFCLYGVRIAIAGPQRPHDERLRANQGDAPRPYSPWLAMLGIRLP